MLRWKEPQTEVLPFFVALFKHFMIGFFSVDIACIECRATFYVPCLWFVGQWIKMQKKSTHTNTNECHANCIRVKMGNEYHTLCASLSTLPFSPTHFVCWPRKSVLDEFVMEMVLQTALVCGKLDLNWILVDKTRVCVGDFHRVVHFYTEFIKE